MSRPKATPETIQHHGRYREHRNSTQQTLRVWYLSDTVQIGVPMRIINQVRPVLRDSVREQCWLADDVLNTWRRIALENEAAIQEASNEK